MHAIQIILYVAALVCWGLAAFNIPVRSWSVGWLGVFLAGLAALVIPEIAKISN